MQVSRLLVWLCVWGLVFSGCSTPASVLPTIATDGGTTNATPSANTTITFAIYDYDRNTYESLIQNFHNDHPNIDVILVSMDDMMQTQPNADGSYPVESPTDYLRKVASGADVFPGYYVTNEAIGSPLLLNMQPFLDAASSDVRADFFPGVLERYNTAQGLYVLPRSLGLQSIAYNRDMFQSAGIAEPKSSWDTRQMFATAEQLVTQSNGTITRYGWFDNSGGAFTLLYLADMAGFDVLTASADHPNQNKQTILDIYRQYQDLTSRGVVLTYNQIAMAEPAAKSMPSDMPTPGMDPVQLIKDGKVGMWSDSTIYDQTQIIPFAQGNVAYPAGSQLRFSVYADSYAISGGTRSPQAAWTFLEWLTRQDIPSSYISYENPGYIMARQSLHEQMMQRVDASYAERLQSYQDTLAQLPDYPSNPMADYSPFYAVVNGANRLSENPPKSVDESFAMLVQEYEGNRNQIGVTPSPTADVRPVVVATPMAQSARPDQVTVTYAAHGYSPSDIRRQLRGFSQAHPDIFIKVIATDNDANINGVADLAQRADCFWWSGALPSSDTELATLADIQPLVDGHPSFDMTRLSPAIVDFFRRDGRLIGIPQGYSTRGLVYNPQLFSTVGIEAPTATWTPEKFLSAARALTGNGVYGYSSMQNYLADIAFWVNQFDGRLASKSGNRIETFFGEPNTVAAITWYLQLATVQNVMPMPAFYYRSDSNPTVQDLSYELQMQGKIGMWFDSGLGSFSTENTDPLNPPPFVAQMAPLPIGNGGVQSADYSVSAWYVSASATHPQACLDVIDFLNSAQANGGNTAYGYIPVDTALASAPAFVQSNGYMVPLRDALQPILASQSGQFTGDTNAVYSFESYWFFEALDQIVYQKADPATALTRAQTLTNTYQTCVADSTPPNIDYAKCAMDTDPTYKGYMVAQPVPVDALP